jgi:hypothetical protein
MMSDNPAAERNPDHMTSHGNARRTPFVPGEPLTPRYVIGPDDAAPDPTPLSAALGGPCDACPAAAVVVVARVAAGVHDDWPSFSAAGVQVLAWCGHHADAWLPALEDEGWFEVACAARTS